MYFYSSKIRSKFTCEHGGFLQSQSHSVSQKAQQIWWITLGVSNDGLITAPDYGLPSHKAGCSFGDFQVG